MLETVRKPLSQSLINNNLRKDHLFLHKNYQFCRKQINYLQLEKFNYCKLDSFY